MLPNCTRMERRDLKIQPYQYAQCTNKARQKAVRRPEA